MRELHSIESIDKALANEEAMLLYISAPKCNVCEVLKPKVEELIQNSFPKIATYEANIQRVPELAARFNILSAPVILLFFEGKEFAREGRNVSSKLFGQKIAKIYDLYFS